MEGMETAKWVCVDSEIAGMDDTQEIGKNYIAACHHVTFEGLLAVSWRDKLHISDRDKHDDEGLTGLFIEKERKAYEDTRTYKTMKNRILLDNPELQAPIHALWEFFDYMNRWEQMAE